MKELFMRLLLNLSNYGNLTEVNMYESGVFSQLKVKTKSGTYSIAISKVKEDEQNED